MSAGRKPKPTEQLQDQGTFRADRHEDRMTVAQPLKEDASDWLTEEEKEYWAKWYGVLSLYDVLKETDEVAFGLLCKTFGRIQEITKQMPNASQFVIEHEADNGAIVKRKNPMYDVLMEQERNLLKLLTEFGMTPASRGKVKTAVQEGEDPFLAAMRSA